MLESSTAVLTENVLGTLDIVHTNITEVTDVAIRTPVTADHHKASLLHVDPHSESAGHSNDLPEAFALSITYRSVQNSTGSLLSLLNKNASALVQVTIGVDTSVTYRVKEHTERLVFHRSTWTPNDGLYVDRTLLGSPIACESF